MNWLREFLIRALKPREVGDRAFKAQIRESALKEVGFESNVSDLETHVLHSIAGQPESRREQAASASRSFMEFLDRLFLRYCELREVEWEMHYWDRLRNRRLMSEIQNDFVNKTEAFHQQVYATISAYIRLLSCVLEQGIANQLPTRRTGKFFEYIESRFNCESMQSFETEFNILKKSREYRSEYVDHTAQREQHDWTTHEQDKCYVSYYRGIGFGVQHEMKELQMGSLKLMTPYFCTSYFIPPHHMDVMRAILKFSNTVLNKAEELRTSN